MKSCTRHFGHSVLRPWFLSCSRLDPAEVALCGALPWMYWECHYVILLYWSSQGRTVCDNTLSVGCTFMMTILCLWVVHLWWQYSVVVLMCMILQTRIRDEYVLHWAKHVSIDIIIIIMPVIVLMAARVHSIMQRENYPNDIMLQPDHEC